jgi:prepilin-type N-terminal cleavage/methylation domain-containing protein
MSAKRLGEEPGYSLVEVMVSVVILTIAILPMMAMFDTGLHSANMGSNYDKARALANKQLELTQSLSYGTVRTDFPNAPCTFDGSGLCEAENLQDPDGEFANFRYAIRKQYVAPSEDEDEFVNAEDDSAMMQITVEVGWGGDNFDDRTYTTTALKSR